MGKQGSTQAPVLFQDRFSDVQHKIQAARFTPELSEESFQRMCDGAWGKRCQWAVIFFVPASSLATDEPSRKALRRFRDACKLTQEHAGAGFQCFWLRYGGPAK